MGDQARPRGKDELDLVYSLLKVRGPGPPAWVQLSWAVLPITCWIGGSVMTAMGLCGSRVNEKGRGGDSEA